MGFFSNQYRKEFFPKDNGKGSDAYHSIFDVCCNGNKKTFVSAAPSKGYSFSKSFLAYCCTGIVGNVGLLPPYNGVGVPNNPPIPNCGAQQFAINNVIKPNNTAANPYGLGVYNQGNQPYLLDNLSIINSGTAPLTLTGFAITSTTATASFTTTFANGTVLPPNGVHNFEARITNIDSWIAPGTHTFTIQAFGTSTSGCTVAPISTHFRLDVTNCAFPVELANIKTSDNHYPPNGIGSSVTNSGTSPINNGFDTLFVGNKTIASLNGATGDALIIELRYSNPNSWVHTIVDQRYSGDFTMNIANTSYPIVIPASGTSNSLLLGGAIIIPPATVAGSYQGILEVDYLVCGVVQTFFIRIEIEVS